MTTTEWSWPARPWASDRSEHPRSTGSFDREPGAIRSRSWKSCFANRGFGDLLEQVADTRLALHRRRPPRVLLCALLAGPAARCPSARQPFGHLDREPVRPDDEPAGFFSQLVRNGDPWQFTGWPRAGSGFVGAVEHPAMMIQARFEEVEGLAPERMVVELLHAVTDPREPVVDTAAIVRLWVSTSASRQASKSGDTMATQSWTLPVDLCRLASINLASRC